MYIPVLLSLIIHAFLFISVIKNSGASDSVKKNSSINNQVKVKILEKPSSIKKNASANNIVSNKKKTGILKKKKSNKQRHYEAYLKYVDHNCDQWYGGIGVEYQGNGCEITRVAEDYPAYRAGILAGDLAISEPNGECPGRGNPNTSVVLKLMRGAKVITKILIREKICTSSGLDITPSP